MTDLYAWEDFPANSVPRPIVILGQLPATSGYGGPEALEKALNGSFRFREDIEFESSAVQVLLPGGGTIDTATVSPAEAVMATPGAQDPLILSEPQLTTAEFTSDRGTIALPAWSFQTDDALSPLQWPAVPAALFYQPGQLRQSDAVARIAATGPYLEIDALIPGTTQCIDPSAIDNMLTIVESEQAVVFGFRPPQNLTAVPQSCSRTAVGRIETFTVELTTPLGSRLLVDPSSAVVPVTVVP